LKPNFSAREETSFCDSLKAESEEPIWEVRDIFEINLQVVDLYIRL
jgi:hypothetical protein